VETDWKRYAEWRKNWYVTTTFICCCLSYCNSLLYGAFDGLIQKLRSVQNAAARLITGSRWYDHISHVLVQLYWLPVRRRVEYKVACLVHQLLSGQTLAYMTDDINLVADSGHRVLRSAVTGLASYHTPTIHTATWVPLLLVHMCGSLCHLWWDWKHFCSGVNWLQYIVTVSCFCAL